MARTHEIEAHKIIVPGLFACWVLLGYGSAAPAVAELPVCPAGAGAGQAHENLSYADLPRNKLDLYTPLDTPPVPLFIWVHGGAWQTGSKSFVPFAAKSLLDLGYAVASVEYRLSGWPWPAQIADIKAAIRWLRAHAAKYGLDPERFAIGGASAGGHLSALAGTSAGVPTLENLNQGNPTIESTVQAVCDFFGPTDFLQADAQAVDAGCGLCAQCPDSPHTDLLDCSPDISACPGKVAHANPITYVDGTDPPFFIAHGDDDCTIPVDQSEILHASLTGAGVESELVVVAGAGHAMSQVGVKNTAVAMWQFLDRNLRGCIRPYPAFP